MQGLTKQKDNLALHTNRAQTNIKLKKFEDALVDCEWALKVRTIDNATWPFVDRLFSDTSLKKVSPRSEL